MSEIIPSIRWMIRRDMTEVLDIEYLSFPNPWNEQQFLDALRQRNCIGMVVEHNFQVVGFMVYELHKSMIQIIDFAVHPDHRLQGVGEAMVKRVIDKLSQQRRREIFASVRETNLGAQLFFRSCGFRVNVIIDDYYDDADESAYVFNYQLERSDSEFATGLSPKNRISKILKGGA